MLTSNDLSPRVCACVLIRPSPSPDCRPSALPPAQPLLCRHRAHRHALRIRPVPRVRAARARPGRSASAAGIDDVWKFSNDSLDDGARIQHWSAFQKLVCPHPN